MDGFRSFSTVIAIEYHGNLFQPLGIEVVEENEVDWLSFGSGPMEPRYGPFERVDAKNIEPVKDSGQEGQSDQRTG